LKIIRRTSQFQNYLDRQIPERAREIIAAERAFSAVQYARGTVRESAETQFAEDLSARVPIEGGETVELMLDELGKA
jgi:hypothetical protein